MPEPCASVDWPAVSEEAMRECRIHRWWRVILVPVVAITCGCGDDQLPTYPVHGTVTFADGTPLRGGTVEFRCGAVSPPMIARGEISQDGTFVLGTYAEQDGAIAGDHQVAIAPLVPRDTDGLPPAERERALLGGIHPRFLNYVQSGITCTVTDDPARNSFPITVEPPP